MNDRYPWTIVASSAALSIAVAVWAFSFPDLDERYKSGLLATARISGTFFLLAFIAGPLVRIRPNPLARALVLNRRYLGLACALAHTVHLMFIALWAMYRPEDVSIPVVAAGGIAYLLILAMAATSNDWSFRRLGRNWKRLHTAGIYYIWLIFLATFAGHTTVLAMLYSVLFVLAMLLRVAATLRGRSAV